MPTSKGFKDPLQEVKKTVKKLILKISELLNTISSIEWGFPRRDKRNRLEKGEKIGTCFPETSTLQKDRKNLSSDLTNKMETLILIYL